MNLSQLHEHVRIEITHRIDGHTLTGASLAAQSRLQASHISNFLHRNRNLSLSALDRVLRALSLEIDDLIRSRVVSRSREAPAFADDLISRVPLVSAAAASDFPLITSAVTLEVIQVPAESLDGVRPSPARARRNWQRFVAVRASSDQSHPMSPYLRPQSILVLDRHYQSLARHLSAEISMACSSPVLSCFAMSVVIRIV
jgi:transcriptional regulator with XRE-family HTH domain